MASLNCSKKLDNFCAPTQKVIDLFKHQRKLRSQFAVVYLTPYPLHLISAKNLTFSTQDGVVDTPDEATDSSQPSFPEECDRYNFIAARPTNKGKIHSEVMLMDGFEGLLDSYEASSMLPCRSVVIYSWFHPCYDCACKIVETLGHYAAAGDLEVVVVYSCVLKDPDSITRVLIHWLFMSSGIKLEQVKSSQYIKPIAKKHCLL